MRSDERPNTAGLCFTASMTSGPSGEVSPSATMTLGLSECSMPLLKFCTTTPMLIGNEMNSMPMFGSSISALMAADSEAGVKPAVTSSGLP